jgi:hypothetical protein
VTFSVVATFLAGLSASEMARSQYHRTMASQNQAKVADQWAFFQAKRIRGTSLQMTAELLGADQHAGPFDRAALGRAAEDLAWELEQAAARAKDLCEEVSRLPGSKRLQAAARQLRANSADRAKEVRALVQELQPLLQDAEAPAGLQGAKNPAASPLHLREALAALALPREDQPEGDPSAFTSALPPAAATQLHRAIAAIKDREPDSRVTQLVRGLDDDLLQQVIAAADAHAESNARAARKTDELLKELDRLLERLLTAGRSFCAAAAELKRAAGRLAQDAEPVQRAGQTLQLHAEEVKALLAGVNASYRASRLGFTARRYHRDAAHNQAVAYLYEVEVHLSSARSDYHMTRSRNFFIGMVVAQLAVIIATLSLMVRLKAVLWGLAIAAGVGAIGFSGYVFLAL